MGDRRLALSLEPDPAGVTGIPAAWTVWRWQAQVPGDLDADLVISAVGGTEVVRRAARRTGAAPAARGFLESPAPGSTVIGGLVPVSGWLLLDGRAPARVEVEVDGAPPARARLALARPDIAVGSPYVRDAGLCGYQARVGVDVAPGEKRDVVVRVTAYTDRGTAWSPPLRSCTVLGPAPDDGTAAAAADRAGRITAQLLSRIRPVTDPAHLLVAGHSLDVGGAELWLLELLGRLIGDHGLRVTLVAPNDGQLRADFEDLGVDVWVTGQHRVIQPGGYHAAVSELALIARSCGAGVGMVNTLGQFAAAAGFRVAGLPVAWVVHESFSLPDFAFQNYGAGGVSPSVLAAWQRTLSEVEELLFVSDATRELFEGYRPLGTSHTVRYGVGRSATRSERDPESLDGPARLREELGIPEDATVLLAVGINQPRKGFGQLVRAFERIGGHHADPHLVIVGLTTSPHSNMLQQRVSADPSSRVHLVPVTRDVGDFLELADIFVNASDVESLPRSILEAIAAGVPVLATDVFGTGELIRDGVSGWLMTANDHTSITAGLLRALDSTSGDRRVLAAAALSHCGSFLDSTGYGAEFAARLESLARGTRTRNTEGGPPAARRRTP